MLTVRVDTLPAGLVPQFDSFVITGGYDEPPIRGELGTADPVDMLAQGEQEFLAMS